jgi:hypothetical protein
VKRSQNPPLKKVLIKKVREVEGDQRKITFVRAVQLPFDKRTIEKFGVGDPAWISWDGRKAIPVIVKKVDDRNYIVEILRPLKNKGNIHSLFLDEVRSTPLLACINCVTL